MRLVQFVMGAVRMCPRCQLFLGVRAVAFLGQGVQLLLCGSRQPPAFWFQLEYRGGSAAFQHRVAQVDVAAHATAV